MTFEGWEGAKVWRNVSGTNLEENGKSNDTEGSLKSTEGENVSQRKQQNWEGTRHHAVESIHRPLRRAGTATTQRRVHGNCGICSRPSSHWEDHPQTQCQSTFQSFMDHNKKGGGGMKKCLYLYNPGMSLENTFQAPGVSLFVHENFRFPRRKWCSVAQAQEIIHQMSCHEKPNQSKPKPPVEP